MPSVPPNLPSVSRVVCHYTVAGSGTRAINVFHVLSSGIAALEVFNRFSTAWDQVQMAHTTTAVTLGTIDVTRLDNSSATETFSTTGAKWTGTLTEDFVPALCLLVKYTTGFRGLASVGHTYAPFVAESLNDNGVFPPASLTAVNAAWVAFVNTLTTQTIPLQVVSYGRFDHPTLPDAPATNHTVTAASVQGVLATQRPRQSRLRG